MAELVVAFLLVLGAHIWVSLEELSPAGAAATICWVNIKNTFNRPMLPYFPRKHHGFYFERENSHGVVSTTSNATQKHLSGRFPLCPLIFLPNSDTFCMAE